MKLFQRSNNAIFIDNLLINIPKDIDKELDITNVLLSNELVIDKETLLRLEAKDVNFYCLKETFFALNTNKPELYNIIDTDFKIGNIKIKAFITKCSLRSDIKNISFKIKDVLYCAYATDIPNVPTTCLIVDATFSGTETYKQILKQSNTNLINMTILINDNKTYLMDNALLNNYWDLNKVSKDLKVMLAKDELEYIVPKKQTLSSIKLGKLCQKIKQNKIILSTEQTLNSKQIYTDNRFAYGVLQLKTKTPISDKWFNTNKLLHNMTNIERNLRFNDSQLYAYTFDIVEEYEPIKIEHLGLFDTMFDKIIFTDVIKYIYP